MRVALLAGYPSGAIDQAMQSLKVGLAGISVEADVLHVYERDFDKHIESYDIVQAGYYPYTLRLEGRNSCPVVANVWHIGAGNEARYANEIARMDIAHIVVDDVMTLQQLGQMGFTNVSKIPMPLNPAKWHHLPPPAGRFTAGVFCNDYEYKRWDVVVKGAKQAGVKCLAFVMPEGRSTYELNPIQDVYAKVHVLASATFVDTNSLPLREALLCGRPVISTHNDGMGRVLKPWANGFWFDGSPRDLAEKLKLCEANYEKLASGARETRMEDLSTIAHTYKQVWEKVLAENE